MSTLYDRIKERRTQLGLSQEELAKKMGYTSRSTIAKIEVGKNDIPQSKIHDFAIALETTPIYLITGEDAQKKTPSAEAEGELSIEEEAERLVSGLSDTSSDTIMLDGKPASREAREAFKNAIMVGIEMARKAEKERNGK